MKTAAERLQFVVKFAQMPLDDLRPGDWLSLQDALLEFLHAKPGQAYTAESGDVLAILPEPVFPQPEEALRTLQAEVRTILEQLVDTRAPWVKGIQTWTPIHVQCALVSFSAVKQVSGNVLTVEGPLTDVFLLTLLLLLIREPTDRLLRCPECQTIFYRIRKQQYCLRLCVNRANVRKWRATKAGKQREADRARARYQHQMRQQTGSRVKVGTKRPRRASKKGAENHAETSRQS